MGGDDRLSDGRSRQEGEDGNTPNRGRATVKHKTAPDNYPPILSARQALSAFTSELQKGKNAT